MVGEACKLTGKTGLPRSSYTRQSLRNVKISLEGREYSIKKLLNPTDKRCTMKKILAIIIKAFVMLILFYNSMFLLFLCGYVCISLILEARLSI